MWHWFFFNEGQNERAQLHLRNWIMRHPNYKSLTDDIDELDFESLELDGLIDLYKKAVARGSTDPEPRMVLGVLLCLSNEAAEAVQMFQEAIQLNRKDYSMWNKLGATLANCQLFPAAMAAYNQMLKLRPNYIRGLVNVGIAHQYQSQHKLAAEKFARALELGTTMNVLERSGLHPMMFHNAWNMLFGSLQEMKDDALLAKGKKAQELVQRNGSMQLACSMLKDVQAA